MYVTPLLHSLLTGKREQFLPLFTPLKKMFPFQESVDMSKQEDLRCLIYDGNYPLYLGEEWAEGAQRQLGNTQIMALLFPIMFSLFLTK